MVSFMSWFVSWFYGIALMVISFIFLSIVIFGGSVTIGTDNQNVTCSTPGFVGRWRIIRERRHQQNPPQ